MIVASNNSRLKISLILAFVLFLYSGSKVAATLVWTLYSELVFRFVLSEPDRHATFLTGSASSSFLLVESWIPSLIWLIVLLVMSPLAIYLFRLRRWALNLVLGKVAFDILITFALGLRALFAVFVLLAIEILVAYFIWRRRSLFTEAQKDLRSTAQHINLK